LAAGKVRRFASVAALVAGLTVVAVAALGGPGSSHRSASGLERPLPIVVVVATAPDLATGLDHASAPDGEGSSAATPPLASPACQQHETGDFVESFETDAGARLYRVHVPPAGGALPLVLNFHGSSRSASDQESYSGLLPLSDAQGFILVSPEGSGSPSGWNISGVYHEDGVDDVGATAILVRQVEARSCIDVQRVYATGFSNGAEMAAQVACALPSVFAAVAAVSGDVYQGCDGPPVPVIAFHGMQDGNIDFSWGRQATSDWAAHNGCANVEVKSVSDDVTVEKYDGCAADVLFYAVADGGHTWPGSADDSGGVGATDHEIDAAALICQFFHDHPKAN
jgi:polyhydroxybutyrate depolymerase